MSDRINGIVAAAELTEQQRLEARRLLPCHGAKNTTAGADACHRVEGWRECPERMAHHDPFSKGKTWCALELQRERHEAIAGHLVRAGVPARERDLLLGAIRDGSGNPIAPLLETAPLALARGIIERKPLTVDVGGAKVELTGDETLIVVAGPPGVGKSLGACWLLQWMHGKFIAEPEIADMERDIATEERAPLLILDDAGEAHNGASGYVVNRVCSLLTARYAAKLLTVVTTNLNRRDFDARYGQRVADRVDVFLACPGKSLRRRSGT